VRHRVTDIVVTGVVEIINIISNICLISVDCIFTTFVVFRVNIPHSLRTFITVIYSLRDGFYLEF